MIEWEDKFSVGISVIDEEHKKLIGILNKAVFANEHLDFTDKTIMNYHNLIRGDYQTANKILEYLKQWLVNNIQVTDKKYIDCFKKNGLK